MVPYGRAALALCLITSMGCGDEPFPFYAFDVSADGVSDATGDVVTADALSDAGGDPDTPDATLDAAADTPSEDAGVDDSGVDDAGGVDTNGDATVDDATADGGPTDAALDPDVAPCDDSDEDGVCDEDDRCAGFDDSIDTNADGVPDGCEPACAGSVSVVEHFGAVTGCTGSVPFSERASLCGEGYLPASAVDWVIARGEAAPTYHYWTDEDLYFRSVDTEGGACAVGRADTEYDRRCEDAPMRVCAGEPTADEDYADPRGNTCTWAACGLYSQTPHAYFGGCSSNVVDDVDRGVLAGTLCVAREVSSYDVALTGDVQTRDSFGAMRGNVYLADTNGVLFGFDQLHDASQTCVVDSYVWSTDDLDAAWAVLHAGSRTVAPGEQFVGPSSLHIPIFAGRYYAFALAWDCSAPNRFRRLPERSDVGFGVQQAAFVSDNSYQGLSAEYLPRSTSVDNDDAYAQHVYVYGVTPAP